MAEISFEHLPVILSHKIRDVIICPNGVNKFSKSCCVMLFDKPDTYRLAPLIASELGRANDTFFLEGGKCKFYDLPQCGYCVCLCTYLYCLVLQSETVKCAYSFIRIFCSLIINETIT